MPKATSQIPFQPGIHGMQRYHGLSGAAPPKPHKTRMIHCQGPSARYHGTTSEVAFSWPASSKPNAWEGPKWVVLMLWTFCSSIWPIPLVTCLHRMPGILDIRTCATMKTALKGEKPPPHILNKMGVWYWDFIINLFPKKKGKGGL